ncbi:MAG: hypothetical protein JWL89_78 [Candidatus Saccharibacteria bacterium]|nr:hypothetical protein [Candidatus Saccharibacteria bacterium]
MSRTTKTIRKFIAALIGFPLVVLGIILIPLPGPGLVVMFLGLLVLSQEFDWAQKHVENARSQIKQIVAKAKNK